MQDFYDISSVASAIGEPARAMMLMALMGEEALTAGELASTAGITAQTASSHLGRLVDAHLIKVDKQGRHKYYRLANTQVAEVLEGLMRVRVENTKPVRRFPGSDELRYARTCYDHLAGELGVKLTEAMQNLNWISLNDNDFELLPKGESCFADLGLDIAKLKSKKRCFARACLDWSERKPHIAGAVGAALLKAMLHKKWLSKHRTGRVVKLTARGQREMGQYFKGLKFN